MKTARTVLIAAGSIALLAGVALAQPPGRPGPGMPGPGPDGFGLLAFDANGDGRLTRAEFDNAQRTRFAAIDANKDGAATPEEFQAARAAEMQTRRAEMSKQRFAELDADRNGQVSPAEFAAAAPGKDRPEPGGPLAGPSGRSHGPGPGPALRAGGPGKLRADADNSGSVSLAEFAARGTEAFTRADTNGDGVVTIAELQARRPVR